MMVTSTLRLDLLLEFCRDLCWNWNASTALKLQSIAAATNSSEINTILGLDGGWRCGTRNGFPPFWNAAQRNQTKQRLAKQQTIDCSQLGFG